MEEKIDLIKEKLSGDIEKDIKYLDELYEQQQALISDAEATINAISVVANEIRDAVTNVDEKVEDDEEIEGTENNEIEKLEAIENFKIDKQTDERIRKLLKEATSALKNNQTDDALMLFKELVETIEKIEYPKVENVMCCTFANDYEKVLADKIFNGEKYFIYLDYPIDVIYVTYARLLMDNKYRKEALNMANRAVYWNYLNREARLLQLEYYLAKKEYVNYTNTVKSLHLISYTPEAVAQCYNLYAKLYEKIKETKLAYAAYKYGLSYFETEEAVEKIKEIEDNDSNIINVSVEEMYEALEENEIPLEPTQKMIDIQRELIEEFVQNGNLLAAKELIENDIVLTRDPKMQKMYESLNILILDNDEKPKKKTTRKKAEKEVEEEKETKTKAKKTITKKDTEKKTTTKKTATKKSTTKTKKETKNEDKKTKASK